MARSVLLCGYRLRSAKANVGELKRHKVKGQAVYSLPLDLQTLALIQRVSARSVVSALRAIRPAVPPSARAGWVG